jgi:hypothetical protein
MKLKGSLSREPFFIAFSLIFIFFPYVRFPVLIFSLKMSDDFRDDFEARHRRWCPQVSPYLSHQALVLS